MKLYVLFSDPRGAESNLFKGLSWGYISNLTRGVLLALRNMVEVFVTYFLDSTPASPLFFSVWPERAHPLKIGWVSPFGLFPLVGVGGDQLKPSLKEG